MATKKLILDTNILIRLIASDSLDLREKAYKLITNPKYEFYVLDVVIFETVYVLSGERYGYGRNQAVTSLKKILDGSNLDYNREVFDLVFEEYPKHPKLSFADCYLCAMANSKGTNIMTFDKKFVSQCKCAKKVS